MKEIIGVYILDSEGGVIFIHEKYTQGYENAVQCLWPKFLVAFQLFVSELGAIETKIVFAKSKIYTGYDETLDVHFVLKCTKIAKTLEMKKILQAIKNQFRTEISEKYESLKDLDYNILNSLGISIKKIIDTKKNIDEFINLL